MRAGDIARGGPFNLGLLMSRNLGICSKQPLNQGPGLIFPVSALVRNVLCKRELLLRATDTLLGFSHS